MFEQSLYEQEGFRQQAVAAPPREGDLFYNYEVRSWVPSPRLYKILGISALANVFALFVFAQTSVLTMKGCDSPLVGRVCQVLDTVYVGSMLWGTDRNMVDAAYDKIDLDDSDITFVDVTGVTPPLSYPEGYFEVANANELAMVDAYADPNFTHGIPGIPSGIPFAKPSTGGSLFDTEPNIPQHNPNAVDDNELPKGFGGTMPKPIKKGPRPGRPATFPPKPKASPKATEDPETDPEGTVAEADPSPEPSVEPVPPVAEAGINKRPFVDLADFINGLREKNEVKLDSPFVISATGKLDKAGKLDPKNFRYVRAESADPNLIEVLKRAIEKSNESGLFQYLTILSGKDLAFQVQQDDHNVVAAIQTEFESDLRANTISSLFRSFLNDKKAKKQLPDADQNDKDDLALLEKATVVPMGKRLIISFNIPKADLQPMLQRRLDEQKALKQVNDNSGAPANNNTGKK